MEYLLLESSRDGRLHEVLISVQAEDPPDDARSNDSDMYNSQMISRMSNDDDDQAGMYT